jgi:hypothetical protein
VAHKVSRTRFDSIASQKTNGARYVAFVHEDDRDRIYHGASLGFYTGGAQHVENIGDVIM